MPSFESTSIDCPTRYAITVVNLLERDARRHHNVFHLGSVQNSSVRIGVKRLDKDAATPACQSGKRVGSRIIPAQQSSLDTDAPGQQQLTKLYNSRFALARSGISSHASTILKRFLGSPTIAAEVVKEIGVSGQRARIARRTLAQAAPSRVSRPASSNA